MDAMKRKRAFTLVELLVVITIIGMLVALLVPAVQSSRAKARVLQCTNNQHELSSAILQYELVKNHLPGSVNHQGASDIGWPPLLFPFLGRNDLWMDEAGWRRGYIPGETATPHISVFVCPSDYENNSVCPLTYAVNLGLYNDLPNSTFNQNGFTGTLAIPGLFRDYSAGPTEKVLLSSVKSPSHTVMLSEKHYLNTNASLPPLPQRQWTDNTAANLGFAWPNYPPQPVPAPQPTPPTTILSQAMIGVETLVAGVKYWPPLSSIHPGIVIVTFCDGHTESISNDAQCTVYAGLP